MTRARDTRFAGRQPSLAVLREAFPSLPPTFAAIAYLTPPHVIQRRIAIDGAAARLMAVTNCQAPRAVRIANALGPRATGHIITAITETGLSLDQLADAVRKHPDDNVKEKR